MGSRAADTESDCAIVAFGPTQAGKSTTIGQLALPGQAAPVAGVGDGESVTQDTEVVQSRIGLMLDTPGINDSRLLFTDAEAGRRVVCGVSGTKVQRVKFLIFESSAGDSIQLRSTLIRLFSSFGKEIASSTVVLATKVDKLDEEEREQRLQQLQAVASEQGLPPPIAWQNKKLTPELEALQVESLREALDKLPNCRIQAFVDFDQQVQAKARQLCDAQPPRYLSVPAQVAEQYTVQVPQKYNETEEYMDYETGYESYDDIEYHSVRDDIEYSWDAPVPFFGLFGVTKRMYGIKIRCRDEPRVVRRSRPVKRQVVKSRTVERERMVDEVRTRMATKYRSVPNPFPLNSFLAEARRVVLEEMRASLLAK